MPDNHNCHLNTKEIVVSFEKGFQAVIKQEKNKTKQDIQDRASSDQKCQSPAYMEQVFMIHLGRCRKASDSHRRLNLEGPRDIESKKAENTEGELYVH